MNKHALLGILGLLLGLLGVTNAQAQDAQKGVEVLTRGPIHEAFAEPLAVNPRPNPIILQKPPADIEELPPDQKPEGTHIQWIPGYFAWDETGDDYIWISGLWRATPPGRQWMPGHWRTDADGSQWVSGYWAVEGQAEIEYLPQPPTSIDVGPSAEAPDADSLYTPGCWVYQERRYLWRPGFWYRATPNWYYNPARYTYSPAGYIFSDGYWDYPVARRGMLFAPVRFSADLWGTPGLQYHPRYAMGNQGFYSSLFVRPEFNRYYHGDYYGADYNRQGFVPWFDYRTGRNTPDPFFNYSRWNSRADTQWEGSLRGLHKDRIAGNAARPPVTLIQQNEFIQNVTINKKVLIGDKTVVVTNPQTILQHMPVIAPLGKGEHKEFKLQPLTKAAIEQEWKSMNWPRIAGHERKRIEANLVTKGAHPTKATDAPTKVKLDVLQNTGVAKVIHAEKPPAPIVHKYVEKPLPKQEIIKPIRIEPAKGKVKEATPPKTKEADKTPPKTKEADKTPPKTKEADKMPPKTKEADKTPPKSKDPDKKPQKSKDEDKPAKTDAVGVSPRLPQRPETYVALSNEFTVQRPMSSPLRRQS